MDEIRELLESIFAAADRRDWATVEAAFADDVVLDYGAPEHLTPAQIIARWQPAFAALDRTHHAVHDYAIEIAADGRTATSHAHFRADHWLAGAPRGDHWTLDGEYEHALARGADGHWRITAMKMIPGASAGNDKIFEDGARLAKARAKPTLIAAEPQLFVADIAASCAFYTQKLGFAVAFVHGDPPFYAQVVRDGARINLRRLDRPVLDVVLREREHLLAATIVLDHAQPLFLEYQAAGVELVQALRTEPWGARTFAVRDPDGNSILFAGAGD